MRIFRTKSFSRFASQQHIGDAALCEAVRRAEAGLIDADLGGGVIKQRIPRQNQGASKGFRAIVLLQKGKRAFFAHGFAKSDQDNIGKDELKAFRTLAKKMLALGNSELLKIMANKTITEVTCDDSAIQDRCDGGDTRNGPRHARGERDRQGDDEDVR